MHMANVWTSFLILHGFVIFGWLAKLIFKNQIQERGFVLVSIYFLQPLLIFWGILLRPIDWTLFAVPATYFVILLVASLVVVPLRFITKDTKNQAILQITGLISNTGNLGIPFGLLLFGPTSVPYTAMINLINSIFVSSFGAYRYSRGSFSIKASIINVIKLPMIWSAAIAILWQYNQFSISTHGMQFLEMAAYCTMVLQLMIFGMFVATIKKEQLEIKNIVLVQITKYIILPIVSWLIISAISLPNLAIYCLIIQAFMPIAVNNMNLAALYDCYPQKVALHALISTIIGLFAIPLLIASLPS